VYIYAPGWRDSSAGIKVLHMLCHRLNSLGIPCWLVIQNNRPRNNCLNPKLKTPMLTKDIRDHHFKSKLLPIVVYPETIINNPLNAKFVVRYILNYAEAFGKKTRKKQIDTYQYCYSLDLTADFPNAEVIWLPGFELSEIPINHGGEISLLYAGKYRSLIGSPPILKNRKDLVEIFRSGPKKQTRAEVMHLLSKAKCLYLYENSMLSLEARLAGVPVIELESDLNLRSIGKNETGTSGICHSDSDENLMEARNQLKDFRNDYLLLDHVIDATLKNKYQIWLEVACTKDYSHPISIPRATFLFSKNDLLLGFAMFRKYGILKTLRKVIESKFRN